MMIYHFYSLVNVYITCIYITSLPGLNSHFIFLFFKVTSRLGAQVLCSFDLSAGESVLNGPTCAFLEKHVFQRYNFPKMGEIALLGLVASSQTSKNFRNLVDLPSGKDSQLENPPFFLLVFRIQHLGQFLNFTEVVTFRVTSGLKE